jgi:hypothetical protein
MKKMNMSRKWKSISIVVAGLCGLSTLSFNCAPSLFQSATYSSSGSMSLFSTFSKVNTPVSLMSGEQIYQSMLNVTGQTQGATTTQADEYQSRINAFPTADSLSNMSSPMMLAASSLAGEVCNGLVAKEKALGASSRRFFQAIDFTKKPADNTLAGFLSAADVLAVSAWGRHMSTDEQKIFSDYFEEYKANLTTTNNAAQTDNLCISACAAVLSSFDALVY